MKCCSYCGKEFPDNINFCPVDQWPLIELAKNEPDKSFKEVGDYSSEELNQFRGIFAADLKQYRAIERRYAHPLLVIFLLGMACVAYASYLSQPPVAWLFGIGVFFFAGGMIGFVVAAFSLPKLKCPACQKSPFTEFGNYCPECGSVSLKPKGWLNTPHCNSCGKDLRSGKGRNFRYKTCTHCGVFLDDKGL